MSFSQYQRAKSPGTLQVFLDSSCAPDNLPELRPLICRQDWHTAIVRLVFGFSCPAKQSWPFCGVPSNELRSWKKKTREKKNLRVSSGSVLFCLAQASLPPLFEFPERTPVRFAEKYFGYKSWSDHASSSFFAILKLQMKLHIVISMTSITQLARAITTVVPSTVVSMRLFCLHGRNCKRWFLSSANLEIRKSRQCHSVFSCVSTDTAQRRVCENNSGHDIASLGAC